MVENAFVLCIRTRKKNGLSLKDCLSIECDTCPCADKCPVKDKVRIKPPLKEETIL